MLLSAIRANQAATRATVFLGFRTSQRPAGQSTVPVSLQMNSGPVADGSLRAVNAGIAPPALFRPILVFLFGRHVQFYRIETHHFQGCPAIRAFDKVSLVNIVIDLYVGLAFRTASSWHFLFLQIRPDWWLDSAGRNWPWPAAQVRQY